jgi:hypothetical protein
MFAPVTIADYAADFAAWVRERWISLFRRPVPGWRSLIAQVISATDANAMPSFQYPDGATLIGAPREWMITAPDVCADSGLAILPGGVPQGVRCARCRRPIAIRFAGMAVSTDVPSCAPCRPAVRRAIRNARLNR